MDKQQVFTVKIYFIEPVEIISIVLDTLIKLEFESYAVNDADKHKLPKLMIKDMRNVVFFSLINDKEVERNLEFIDQLTKGQSQEKQIQIGAFVNDSVKPDIRFKLLERGIAVIQFSDIMQDTVKVLRRILSYFEAKGVRKYIRCKTVGKSEAYFTVKNLEQPIKTEVVDISSHAFLCRINQTDRMYFGIGDYCHEILLVLKGIRIRTSAKILGFNKDEPSIFILKLCSAKVVDNKLSYIEKLPPENKNKLHNYIKICLKENLSAQLSTMED